MAYTTSVRAFRGLSSQDPLVDSYRLLVAMELALKDASFGPSGGHDVPTMLITAAQSASAALPFVSAQLNGYAATLLRDLGQITCNDRYGKVSPVPGKSYPYLRYGRRVGDWGGVAETPAAALGALESTCHLLCTFLIAHGAKIGVHL